MSCNKDAVSPICEFLTDESKWTKGTEARNSNGEEIDPLDENATSFCAMGLLNKFYGPDNTHQYYRLRDEIGNFIAVWNDISDFQTVKGVFCKLGL